MRRLAELDSLRGLAAVTVVAWHHLIAVPVIWNAYATGARDGWTGWLFLPPVSVLCSGHSAVVLFFVLSGYVLSLPFLGDRAGPYPSYAARRWCRIWPPYVAAVVVAMIACAALGGPPPPGTSAWFGWSWDEPVTRKAVVEHVLFVWPFVHWHYNNVIWSLIHEMRLSLVFPLLFVVIVRRPWPRALVLATALALVGWYLPLLHWRLFWLRGPGQTVHYSLFFVLGALLAKHRGAIGDWYAGLSRTSATGGLVLGLLLYTIDGWAPLFVPTTPALDHHEYLIGLGAVVLVVWASNTAWLRLPALTWLGKVSFSLYLIHLPILLTVVRLGHGRAPLSVLLLSSAFLAFPAAWLMHGLVEAPSMRLGRVLGDRLSRRGAALPCSIAAEPPAPTSGWHERATTERLVGPDSALEGG